jgi:hypothetical protein
MHRRLFMQMRAKLIAKIKSIGSPPVTPDDPALYPVVSLDDFFEGNHDESSIGCNLADLHLGVGAFYEVLNTVRGRHDVSDVMVEITDLNDDSNDAWPFSDRVYIITSASQDEVDSWVRKLRPDEVAEGFPAEVPVGFPPIPAGSKVSCVWWD